VGETNILGTLDAAIQNGISSGLYANNTTISFTDVTTDALTEPKLEEIKKAISRVLYKYNYVPTVEVSEKSGMENTLSINISWEKQS
jgi:hypothetical protein